jgi:hypothetical protein
VEGKRTSDGGEIAKGFRPGTKTGENVSAGLYAWVCTHSTDTAQCALREYAAKRGWPDIGSEASLPISRHLRISETVGAGSALVLTSGARRSEAWDRRKSETVAMPRSFSSAVHSMPNFGKPSI